jgi:four helix bundle protein
LGIRKFEDIEAWRVARCLTKEIYTITSRGEFSKDFGLREQIRRASVSIMSNIAEGFERDGNKEFKQFLSTAKGSAGEVKSQLYIALDVGFISDEEFNVLCISPNWKLYTVFK